ncbi:MAG: hypothetical protein MHPSP_000314 [Paramarteilia canceri]
MEVKKEEELETNPSNDLPSKVKEIEIWLLHNELDIIKENFAHEVEKLMDKVHNDYDDKKLDIKRENELLKEEISVLACKEVKLNEEMTNLLSLEREFLVSKVEITKYKELLPIFFNKKLTILKESKDLADLENTLNELNLKADSVSKELNQHEKAYSKLKEENSTRLKRLDFQMNFRDSKDDLEKLEASNDSMKTSIKNTSKEIKKLRLDLDYHKKNSALKESSLQTKKNQIVKFKQTIANEISKMTEKLSSLQKQSTTIQGSLQQVQSNLSEFEMQFDAKCEEQKQLDTEVQQMQNQTKLGEQDAEVLGENILNLRKDINHIKNSSEDLKREIDSLVKVRKGFISESKNQIMANISRIKPSESILAQKQSERDKIRMKAAEERLKIDQIEKKMYAERSQLILQENELQNIIDKSSEKIKVDDRYRKLKEEISEKTNELNILEEQKLGLTAKIEKEQTLTNQNLAEIQSILSSGENEYSKLNSENENNREIKNSLEVKALCLEEKIEKIKDKNLKKEDENEQSLTKFFNKINNSPNRNFYEIIVELHSEFQALDSQIRQKTQKSSYLKQLKQSNDNIFHVI